MSDLSPPLQAPWRLFVRLVIIANLAAIAAVVVVHWPDPAAGLGGRFERNLMAWFTSVQLVLAGFSAGLVFLLELAMRKQLRIRVAGSWIWPIFALGCFYLGADEYLGVHERIDDRLGAWLSPGMHQPPLTLSLCLAIGLVPGYVLWARRHSEGAAVRWFALALALSAGAILLDVGSFRSWLGGDFVWRAGEDCLELFAGAAFLLAFMRAAFARINFLSASSSE